MVRFSLLRADERGCYIVQIQRADWFEGGDAQTILGATAVLLVEAKSVDEAAWKAIHRIQPNGTRCLEALEIPDGPIIRYRYAFNPREHRYTLTRIHFPKPLDDTGSSLEADESNRGDG